MVFTVIALGCAFQTYVIEKDEDSVSHEIDPNKVSADDSTKPSFDLMNFGECPTIDPTPLISHTDSSDDSKAPIDTSTSLPIFNQV